MSTGQARRICRSHVTVATIMALLLTASSRGEAQIRPTLSDTLERGTVVNGVYANRYFGVELPLPSGWVAITDEELQRHGPVGEILTKIRSGAPLSSLPLLPWVVLANVNTPAAGATGGGNIFLSSSPLGPNAGQMPMPAVVEQLRRDMEAGVPGQKITVEQEQLGGRTVRYIDGIIGPKELRQRQWVAQVRGHAVAIVGTYQNPAQLAEIRGVLQKLVINGPAEAPAGTADSAPPRPATSLPMVEPAKSEWTDVLERGGVVQNVYRNRFFGFRLPVPAGWRVLTDTEILSGPQDIASSFKQIQAGVPLANLGTVPLILMENRGGPAKGAAAANIAAMAIRLKQNDDVTMSALEKVANGEMDKEVPGRRVTAGHDQLSGQRVPFVDRNVSGGLQQREWYLVSRGYFIILTGTYQNAAGLNLLRQAMQGLVLDATPK